MHGSKCQKCNNLHKLEHYREIAWYYKTNFKINPPRLETKKEKPCTTLSNTSTVKANIRLIAISVHSGNTGLIKSGITRRYKSSCYKTKVWTDFG